MQHVSGDSTRRRGLRPLVAGRRVIVSAQLEALVGSPVGGGPLPPGQPPATKHLLRPLS